MYLKSGLTQESEPLSLPVTLCHLHPIEACNGSEWLNKLKEMNKFKSAGLVLARFNGVVRAKCANVTSNLKCCLQVKLPKHERLLFSMSVHCYNERHGCWKATQKNKTKQQEKRKKKNDP